MKTLLLDFWDATRDFAAEQIRDFKESTRTFKIKVGILSGYVGVSLVTVLVFIPPGELNEIDAVVRLGRTEIVGGRYFQVTNESSEDWKDVVLTLNGGFVGRSQMLKSGQKKAFYFDGDFKDRGGKAPSQALLVTTLRIDCSEGSFERQFEGGQ